MITSQGERDREGRMAGERRETESGQDGERGGRMAANVLKEIAGRVFPGVELKPWSSGARGGRESV